jgi:tetratricopeptide (TPR) repeat protein
VKQKVNMRKFWFVMAGASVMAGFGYYEYRHRIDVVNDLESAIQSNPDPAGPALEEKEPQDLDRTGSSQILVASTDVPSARLLETHSAARVVSPRSLEKPIALPHPEQSIELLVSPSATFDQKQAEWKHLKDSGSLGEIVAGLEKKATNNPQDTRYVAALGQAYLKQCAGMEDVREQAFLAMKADKTLEYALSLEPSNWEARYIKTVGMSYWPPQLNKAQEVLDQFRILIQEQETLPAEPQFARSYLRLGEQYQKSGQLDYATQVWQRGASFFPDNAELKNKLSSVLAN